MDLDLRRRFYAEELEAICRLRSAALVDALAAVPRERFLPPGPWTVLVDVASGSGLRHPDTRDDTATRPVVLVNAGLTHPLESWLDAVTPGGKLVLPLTGTMAAMGSTSAKESSCCSRSRIAVISPCGRSVSRRSTRPSACGTQG